MINKLQQWDDLLECGKSLYLNEGITNAKFKVDVALNEWYTNKGDKNIVKVLYHYIGLVHAIGGYAPLKKIFDSFEQSDDISNFAEIKKSLWQGCYAVFLSQIINICLLNNLSKEDVIDEFLNILYKREV